MDTTENGKEPALFCHGCTIGGKERFTGDIAAVRFPFFGDPFAHVHPAAESDPEWTCGNEKRFAITRSMPMGVIAGIVPFNFPMNPACHKTGPAIAAGNAIIPKPASATPVLALMPGKMPCLTEGEKAPGLGREGPRYAIKELSALRLLGINPAGGAR